MGRNVVRLTAKGKEKTGEHTLWDFRDIEYHDGYIVVKGCDVGYGDPKTFVLQPEDIKEIS